MTGEQITFLIVGLFAIFSIWLITQSGAACAIMGDNNHEYDKR